MTETGELAIFELRVAVRELRRAAQAIAGIDRYRLCDEGLDELKELLGALQWVVVDVMVAYLEPTVLRLIDDWRFEVGRRETKR
jgi:CHAD domain-containing protein